MSSVALVVADVRVMLFERVLAKLDKLLPTSLRSAGTDTIRRARLAVFFPALMIAPGPVFTVLFLTRGQTSMALQCFVLDMVIAVSFAILRFTASIRASIVYFSLAYTTMLVLIFMSPGGGGASSAGIVWMSTAPVIALLVDGRGAGRVALVGALGAVGVLVLHSASSGAAGATSNQQEVISGAINDVLIMLSFYGLATVFESAQRRAHSEVTARERDVRLLLDHTGQGFMTIRRDGTLFGAQSHALHEWFGDPRPGDTIGSYVGRKEPDAGLRFAMVSTALLDGFMPDEVVFDQIPHRVRVDTRTLRFELSPIADSADLLVVVSDVTAEVLRERNEAAQREMVAITEHALRDLRGLQMLVGEADRAMSALEGKSRDTFRIVHTLKGNMALFGVVTVAQLCHELEEILVDRPADERQLTSHQMRDLFETYQAFRERAQTLLRGNPNVVSVSRKAVDALRARIEDDASPDELLAMLSSWDEEPVEQSLDRLGAQARGLAERLGKGSIKIEIDGGDVTLPGDKFAPFWSSAVHLIRNAVDHGLETPEHRVALGKPADGTISLRASSREGVVEIEVKDDGAGIDWASLRERARKCGLPHQSASDLVSALFADGVTTRDETSEISGRGVGLAAVAAVVTDLGGHIDVHSSPRGTSFLISFAARNTLHRGSQPRLYAPQAARAVGEQGDSGAR